MRRRLERAQQWLLTSKASVKEIGYEIGLPDPACFVRALPTHCHTTSSAYRAAHTA